jgi:branched-chain amino acid transport system substrate-binding protein
MTLLALMSATGLSAAGVAPSNGNVITLGVAADLTGPADSIGWRQANAVRLAVDQVNAAGGLDVGGVMYTLALVAADSNGDAAQPVAAANALLTAGAVAVVGHTRSSHTLAAQGTYHAAGVALVSASATTIDLTQQGYNTTFRVCPKDGAEATLMAAHLRRLGMDAVAVVEWGGFEWLADVFVSAFTGQGGAITSRRSVASTGAYNATLTAIVAESPDAVFYADAEVANAGQFSSIAHGLGLPVVGWANPWGDETGLGAYATAAGAGAEGDLVGLMGRRTGDMPGYAAMNAAYQAAGYANYGDEAGLLGAYAYDAARIIIAAIGRANSTAPGDIRAAIAATSRHPGVLGIYSGFDALGDVIPQWAWLERYAGGTWSTAYPFKAFGPMVVFGR